MTLSSSEAEYVTVLEALKKICFIDYLLQSIGMNMKLPIVVSCNNVGAIFMAKNLSSGVGTKHVNTRYHFIQEYIEDDFIKTVF